MTEEQYIRLTEYKDILYTATERNYVMFGTIQRKEGLSVLYTEVFNKKSKMLNGCGTCALRECKELGVLYFKEKKIRDQKVLEPKEDNTTVTEEVKEVKKNKKSQKRNE
jgi:hypothetical protein